MNSAPKRPMAVWIALAIMLFYVSLIVVVIFLPTDSSVLDTPDISDVAASFVEIGGVILSLLIGLGALAMRKQWGRWFVLAPIIFVSGVLTYDHFFPKQIGESSEDYMNLLLGASVGLSPLLIAFFLVSFGPRVNEYFSRTD